MQRSTGDGDHVVAQVSIRSLTASLGLAKDTVARAVRRLRDVGVIYAEHFDPSLCGGLDNRVRGRDTGIGGMRDQKVAHLQHVGPGRSSQLDGVVENARRDTRSEAGLGDDVHIVSEEFLEIDE